MAAPSYNFTQTQENDRDSDEYEDMDFDDGLEDSHVLNDYDRTSAPVDVLRSLSAKPLPASCTCPVS